MARKIIKRFIPGPDWVKKQRSLRFLGRWIHDPNIWHLNRHSVSNAVFIGLALAFFPLPLQMLLAAALAVLSRANLPLSVVLVWISNPLTMAPIFYSAYLVGLAVTGAPVNEFDFELSWNWLSHGLAAVWQPFLLGCLLCGLFFGSLGYATVRLAWRWHAIKRWQDRKRLRQDLDK